MSRDFHEVAQEASTGALPGWDAVDRLVNEAHRSYAGDSDGTVADYIPILAEADPGLFGLAVIEADGGIHDAGEATHAFSIQSISKLFVYALVIQELGHAPVREIVGVNNTGLAFNSLIVLAPRGPRCWSASFSPTWRVAACESWPSSRAAGAGLR